jgi:hypothetical protein
MKAKSILGFFLQIFGAMIAFAIALMISNAISPISPEMTEAGKYVNGFLPAGVDFLFNMIVNAVILVWMARQSSFKGLTMFGQLFLLSFGVQTFQTQVETGYFMSAFPLLHDNFQLYNLIWRGFLTSLFFSVLVTWIVGGFSKKPRPESNFIVTADNAVKQGAWLSVAYLVLYLLFGYFVAWQVQELRLFYAGPAELNGFFEQWGLTLMAKPELPVFQYFRGALWMACLIPLFKGFAGKRVELVIISALVLGLLPTAQLSFANPLMPAAVSLSHFWEILISNGLFGALCAWFVPKAVEGKPA